jgi:hypothetical protein
MRRGAPAFGDDGPSFCGGGGSADAAAAAAAGGTGGVADLYGARDGVGPLKDALRDEVKREEVNPLFGASGPCFSPAASLRFRFEMSDRTSVGRSGVSIVASGIGDPRSDASVSLEDP